MSKKQVSKVKVSEEEKEQAEVTKKGVEQKIVDLVMNAYSNFSLQRQGLEKKWVRDDKQYHNLIENRNYRGMAWTKVPATYDAVITLLFFLLDMFFIKGTPVAKKPFGTEDKEKVEVYNKFNKLKQSNIGSEDDNFRLRILESLLSYLKYGLAIVKMPYNPQLGGADYIPLSIWDVYYNLLTKDTASLDMIIHRLRKTENELVENGSIA